MVMRYKLLGKSGLRVSELCLGAMTGWVDNKAHCKALYQVFVDAGGNFFDTANIYGASEFHLGRLTQGHREKLVLATKYTCATDSIHANAGGNHRKNMVISCEASLRRLKTDYIDVYWMHAWDQITPVDEVMRAFDDLIRQGKILYCGVSNTPAWWVARANTIAEFRDWPRFIGLQVQYNLLERTVERELIPAAMALDLTVTAWSPLAHGLLCGKRSERLTARQMRVVEAVAQTARELSRTPAQVALAWLRSRSAPIIPIIGASKPSQLQDNLHCLDVTLDSDQLRRLDEASSFELGFPHDFLASEVTQGAIHGGTRDYIDL